MIKTIIAGTALARALERQDRWVDRHAGELRARLFIVFTRAEAEALIGRDHHTAAAIRAVAKLQTALDGTAS